jgi:cellobiose epimerase
MNEPGDSSLQDAAWNLLPAELETELNRILQYWEQFAADRNHEGFYGRIDENNIVDEGAPRGSVLNARVLWTFSAAYHQTGNPVHLDLATRAYCYIRDYLTDQKYGGLYWSVDPNGEPHEPHKQIYAQAFGIYGLSEYYRASKNPAALEAAVVLYELIENHSRDLSYGGYIDAFSRDWSLLEDKRLSAKDENAAKTMNTHLHVVEAYANLYAVFPSSKLRNDIRQLLQIFNEKIILPQNNHLALFFSEQWIVDDRVISYGHDIEAGWLLQSCAESIQDPELIAVAKKNAVAITLAAMEGLDDDGGLWYEYNRETGKRTDEKHWWPQAEALIGFCNAWQLTGEIRYKNALLKSWHFIKNKILDLKEGEWLWGVDPYNNKMWHQDKVGIWKCPYHNSRACLEGIKRLK